MSNSKKKCFDIDKGFIEIWEVDKTNSVPFIRIVVNNETSSLSGRQLELLAINILKELKSKKLRP